MSNYQTPALILGFIRKEPLLNLFSMLAASGLKRIYVSMDGPRSRSELAFQNDICEQLDFLALQFEVDFSLKRSEKNQGLSAGVISGIDWFFEHEFEGLILEDDLILEEDFLLFAEKALIEFRDRSEVIMISGNRFSASPNLTTCVYSNYPLIWGWATWKTQWEEMRTGITSNAFPNKQSFPSLKARSFWGAAKIRVDAGLLNSWAAPLAIFCMNNNKIVVQPPVNLVANRGDDRSATHSTQKDASLYFPTGRLLSAIDFGGKSEIFITALENKYLEKHVYKIRFRNVLSLPKAILEIQMKRVKKCVD